MISAMILAKAMPLFQAVSPDLQQAIQEEVQQELRRGRFRGGFGAGGAEALQVFIPIAFFAMIVLIVFVIARRRQAELRARAEFQKQILDKFWEWFDADARFIGNPVSANARPAVPSLTDDARRHNAGCAGARFSASDATAARVCCAGRFAVGARRGAIDIGRGVVSFLEEVDRRSGNSRRAFFAQLNAASLTNSDEVEREPGLRSGRRRFGRTRLECAGYARSRPAHGRCGVSSFLCQGGARTARLYPPRLGQ